MTTERRNEIFTTLYLKMAKYVTTKQFTDDFVSVYEEDKKNGYIEDSLSFSDWLIDAICECPVLPEVDMELNKDDDFMEANEVLEIVVKTICVVFRL